MPKATKGQITAMSWGWRPSIGAEGSIAQWHWECKRSPDCRKNPCPYRVRTRILRRMHRAYG